MSSRMEGLWERVSAFWAGAEVSGFLGILADSKTVGTDISEAVEAASDSKALETDVCVVLGAWADPQPAGDTSPDEGTACVDMTWADGQTVGMQGGPNC